MRRIRQKKGTKKAKEKALEQFRKTREKLDSDHPELLGDMRETILAAQQDKSDGGNQLGDLSDSIPIDRAKNMATILKFVEMKSDSELVQSALKGILSKKYH